MRLNFDVRAALLADAIARMAAALGASRREGTMKRYIDLSVTVDETTMSPPSTNMKLEITPHNRGPGFWQVSTWPEPAHRRPHRLAAHVFKDGITTAEISLDQVMGEAVVVDCPSSAPNHAVTIDDLKRGGADA